MGQTGEDVADPGGFWHTNSNKNPDQPDQPDYLGAAKVQAGGSIGTAMANNLMARNNVNSTLGSSAYKQIGSQKINIPGLGEVDIPQYEQNINLSPEQQSLYDTQTGLQQGLMGQFGENMQGGSGALVDKAYGAMTSRLDPQWAQRESAQKTQLANQGLAPGGEAYTNAMRDFNSARNDAYQQATLGALQATPLEMQLRAQPLNELNAIRSGSPVSMPQFQATQFPGQAQGPNTMGALGQQSAWEQAMYNSQVQQANANKQGLMGLGAAGLMAFSDRRLKSNIVKVGEHPSGFGIYEYDIFGHREIGVMADEVEKVIPQAVGEYLGFKVVNYGML